MKRPIGLLGLASILAGWLVYPTPDATGYRCNTGALVRWLAHPLWRIDCSGGERQVYVSVALAVLGVALLFRATRTRPIGQLLLAVLVLAALVPVAASSHEDGQREAHRLQLARRDLAALQIPAGLTSTPGCASEPSGGRCLHSPRDPLALRGQLMSLLSTATTTPCITSSAGVPCSYDVYGTIRGYPVKAFVVPDVFTEEDHPAGSKRYLSRLGQVSYVDGTSIDIVLMRSASG